MNKEVLKNMESLLKKLEEEDMGKFDVSEEKLEELRKLGLDFVNSLKVIKYENSDGTIQELVHGFPGSWTMLDKVTMIEIIKEATTWSELFFLPIIPAAIKAPGMCRILFPVKKLKGKNHA